MLSAHLLLLKVTGQIYGYFFLPSIPNYSFLFLGVFQSVMRGNRSAWLNKSPGNSQIGQR